MKGCERAILEAIVIIAVVAITVAHLPAQPPAAEPAFLKGRERAVWVSNRSAIFRKTPNGPPIKTVLLGDRFKVTGESGEWLSVENAQGDKGYLQKSDTSAIWILVEKSEKKLTLFKMREVVESWRTDFGAEPVGDKIRAGDHKTPEGEFYVCRKIPVSQFYKAFLISYPDIVHADRALKEKIITAGAHSTITRAIKSKGVPPQDTGMGGLVEIHGKGTGGLYNWTLGCVGVPDSAIDFMWDKVVVGTPIVIIP